MEKASRFEFIRKRLDEVGKTQADLARILNISRAAVVGIINETRKIQTEELVPLAKFLQLDIEDFANYISGEDIYIQNVDETEPDAVKVPYFIDIEASAGTGVYIGCEYVESYICVSKGRMEQYLTHVHKPAVIRVKGDSMCETLQDGDLVLVDTETEFEESKVFVINIENQLYIKRLFSHPVTKEIICKSDNPKYPEYIVKPAQLEIKSRLIAQVFKVLN